MTPIAALASIPPAEPAARPAAPASAPAEERSLWDRMWGKEGFSFGALLDIVNPLQHIPVVSTIYRAITGDTIGPAPRIMGGAIFGGVVGLIASAADSAVEAITGKDTGSHVLAMLPEPDPAPQWAMQDLHDEKRGHRPQMAGLMNVPDGTTMLAADSENHDPTVVTTGDRPATPLPVTADSAAAAAPPADAAPTAPNSPVAAHHPLNVPARTAQMGAGGRQVPLAANGRAGVLQASLPTPQTLAADPALLREMRQGGAAALQKTGRIDTAIKGQGLVAPATANGDAPAAKPIDSAVRNARPIVFDGDANGRDSNASAETRAGVPRSPTAIPEVGPDFLMKMQQALDKYQAARSTAPPSIDVSH